MMSGSDSISLENTEFTGNISKTFQDIRSSREFSDVTLACEDHQIEAHRVVLASGSQFFKRIFTRYGSSPKTLVLMRGVKKTQMMSILDFLYCGEASVLEHDLEDFLFIANDLGLQGLSSNDQAERTFAFERQSGVENSGVRVHEEDEIDVKERRGGFEELRSKLTNAFKIKDKPTDNVPIEEDAKLTEDDQENMMEKLDGVWSCKVGATTTSSPSPFVVLQDVCKDNIITNHHDHHQHHHHLHYHLHHHHHHHHHL